jgi:RNA polymerase sigma-70 factor (ECF subfamily)
VEFQARIDMIRNDPHLLSFGQDAAVKEKTKEKSKVFEELMAWQEKVFLICLGYSRNKTDAQDLTQEVYLKVYRNIGTLKDLSLSKFWLFRITRNTCLDFIRKHRLHRPSSLEVELEPKEFRTPESQLIFQEQLRALKVTIQKLPKKLRDVFILKEYGGLSYQEIAEVLKIKEGTVPSRLTRARQAILNQMKGEKNEKRFE